MHKDEIHNQLILSLMDARAIQNTSENIVSILESLFHKESSKEFAEYIKELHVLCDLVECLENHEKYLEKLHELGK